VSPEVEQVEVRRVTAEDLKRATAKFSRSKLIGMGPAGTCSGVAAGARGGRQEAVIQLADGAGLPGGGARQASEVGSE